MKNVMGLIRPYIDVHTLGLSELSDLLTESGCEVIIAEEDISKAAEEPYKLNNAALINHWIKSHKINKLGFSYRLDPGQGVFLFESLKSHLNAASLDQIEKLAFAGLPAACEQIKIKYPDVITFYGNETPKETLLKLGIDPALAPESMVGIHEYDVFRDEAAAAEVSKGNFLNTFPPKKNYPGYGTKKDTLIKRINSNLKSGLPVIRAHSGPYVENTEEAIEQYLSWCHSLAASGFLDVLSIGSSQLSQSHFGQDWEGLKNGGGVPINSINDLERIYEASRPMLVRTYAGTTNIPELAGIYEKTINIAWHALSLFWFNELDGRGPYHVLRNLEDHLETIEYIAQTGKPYEANLPHHFGFRGSDDTSYVLSSVLAAKTAKFHGIKEFILQIMMNTPKKTWGIMDIAKARASLELVKELEDENFRVYVQSRTGLNYLSFNLEKARIQLYSSALQIGDIFPMRGYPDILHVVSYPEAHHLARPKEIDESIQLMIHAIKNNPGKEYWKNTWEQEITERKEELKTETASLLKLAEARVPHPYSAKGLYTIFQSGFFPVPQLRFKRENYDRAVRWDTKMRYGRVDIFEENLKMALSKRIEILEDNLTN